MKKLNAVSFFTGAGGLDMGIEKSGFDIKLCIEIEKKYCDTLKMNHPKWNINNVDIMKYNKNRIYEEAGLESSDEISLMFGGSPCQSFSTAGKRQAFDDPRGQAMLKYASLIQEIKPCAFLLENVRGFLSASLKHRKLSERGIEFPPLSEDEMPGSAVKYLLKYFTDYNVEYKLINAADYGVPQKRERVIFVGIRKDLNKKFKFPSSTYNKDGSKGKNKWISVGEVFKYINDNVNEHHYLSYSNERLKYMTLIPKGGGNWRDLPSDAVKEVAMGGAYNSTGGRVGFFRRLKLNEPSPTLLTTPHQKSTNLGHPLEDRPLSIEEYLMIQGFPLDYQISGNLNDQYTQVGNAVPIKLAHVIGSAIYNLLK